MFVTHNGLIVPEYMFQLNHKNRAFQYGDGFFETMVFRNGKISFYEDHFARILQAIEVFDFDIPDKFEKEKLRADIRQLIEKNHLMDGARIKLMCYRKPGGYYTPAFNEFEFLITAQSFHSDFVKNAAQVEFYDEFPTCESPISKFKTINSLAYVFAGKFCEKLNINDVILMDQSEHVSECMFSNIFWIKNQSLYTPSLKTGCIGGIMRRQVISAANAVECTFQEGLYKKEDLMEADFVFTSNATGFRIIQHIEGKAFKSSNPLFDGVKEEIVHNI